MKKALLGTLFPALIWSGGLDLGTIIAKAEHNSLSEAKSMKIRSKQMEAEAAGSAYAPTIDIGLSGMINSPVTKQTPGSVGTAFVKAQMNLFDGGRKGLTREAKLHERDAALYEKKAFEKSTALGVVRQYFALKKLQANLAALRQRRDELSAQLARVKKLKKAGMTTSSSVARLEAAYEGNRYGIENMKLAIESSEENLKLLSGLRITHLKRNYIVEPGHVHFRLFDSTRAMQAQAQAIGKSADAIRAAYSPQVNMSYTYNKLEYSDLARGVPSKAMPDHSHKFQMTVAMRLYDGGTVGRKSEAVRYSKLALLSQIRHEVKKQKMNFHLARKRLHTTKVQIQSTRSALLAARSAYDEAKKNYEAGVIDNVTYLDALSGLTEARARYQATRYDYEVNKAMYYFYAGQNIRRYIK
jgi:outer membrane protein TolC